MLENISSVSAVYMILTAGLLLVMLSEVLRIVRLRYYMELKSIIYLATVRGVMAGYLIYLTYKVL